MARSVGDDIYGKSMTRAYTVTAQQKGYRGTPLPDKPKLVVCEAQCGFKIWKTVCEKTLTQKQVETLVKKGKTGIIKCFKSKAGKNFDAALILKDKTTGATKFEFQQKNNTK